MVRYRPQLGSGVRNPQAAIRSRKDWIILCEASSDREPLLARTQIEIVRSLLGRAEPDDNFVIVRRLTPANCGRWAKPAG